MIQFQEHSKRYWNRKVKILLKPLRVVGGFNFIFTKLVGYKIDKISVLGICTAVDSVASTARLPALESQLRRFAKCGWWASYSAPSVYNFFLIYRMKTITGVLCGLLYLFNEIIYVKYVDQCVEHSMLNKFSYYFFLFSHWNWISVGEGMFVYVY